ncbi:MAG: hypothetical protein ACJAUP_000854 [Cellvibrionaceae bacterium]|jgi:hypothetical protein
MELSMEQLQWLLSGIDFTQQNVLKILGDYR